ncbi:hypothetical protein Ahy_B08g091029 isoform A [Arachis hypogaea]|uniref:SWIM-type domain-containing protein n=1 Tax=Arachis hypogaea TaxID=3818 RepID=A0A444Y173_ARAHY|nr:hypothetical protein Ahy_B08g091029 isoform A [Arachis hypogaea]
MKSMIDNREKLANYQGLLPPVQQSRLEAMTKLSQHWSPQWSGDQNEELYEVHGWPTTMVVDLGNRTCTCRFWQLTGMPCMHAISCIQDKNDKRAEDYCHEWLTMESYRKTYAFHVNPVKGQELWEKTGRPAPVPAPIKPKPGRPTKNRRKDKDEGGSGSKTRMKRKYNPIRCMFCSEVGHNKRTCQKKKQADAEEEARLMQLQLALTNPNTDVPNELPTDADGATLHNPLPLSVSPPPKRSNAATETTPVCFTALTSISFHYSCLVSQFGVYYVMQAKMRGRPPKVQVCKGKGKRAASPHSAPPTAIAPISAGTIRGSSAATTKKLASFMIFVPTPGFKRPRKKDDAI